MPFIWSILTIRKSVKSHIQPKVQCKATQLSWRWLELQQSKTIMGKTTILTRRSKNILGDWHSISGWPDYHCPEYQTHKPDNEEANQTKGQTVTVHVTVISRPKSQAVNVPTSTFTKPLLHSHSNLNSEADKVANTERGITQRHAPVCMSCETTN